MARRPSRSRSTTLHHIREAYGVSIDIEPEATFVCDRSLNGARFRDATGWQAPSWPAMIQDMCQDYPRTPSLVRRAS